MTAETRAAHLRAELDRFIDILSADPHTHQIILFGSMVDGTLHEWSDLDIAVIMESNLPFLDRITYIDERVRSNLAMDILVYTPDEWKEFSRSRPFIRDEIAAKGWVMYERSI